MSESKYRIRNEGYCYVVYRGDEAIADWRYGANISQETANEAAEAYLAKLNKIEEERRPPRFSVSIDGIWARVNNDKRTNATALFDGTTLPDAEERARKLCDELNGVNE